MRRVIAFLALVLALVGGPFTAVASAHPLSTSAVLLDVASNEVTGQVQMPIDRLAIALDLPLTADSVVQPEQREFLRGYVLEHLFVSGAAGTWSVQVNGGRVSTVDAVDHVVYDVVLTPPSGTVADFTLHYDGIVHHLLSHRIFVSQRTEGVEAYTTVGLLDWQQQDIAVTVAPPTAAQGFLAAIGLGIHHISDGADHMLFLVMLLLPAPLLARSGRWVRGGDLRRTCRRTVHVVTAFAIGHSLTLVLGALGYVHVPTRVVESLIAASILVSAVHALRPLVPGGETQIAVVFGLMHGLAFAALIGELDLSRGSLVTELLGFNLGIELTQLIVVALLMPSLLLLSRTRTYTGLRTTVAATGAVLAAAWLAERTTLIGSNPLEGVAGVLIEHPFVIAVAVTAVAVASWLTPALRLPAAPTTAGRPVDAVVGSQARALE